MENQYGTIAGNNFEINEGFDIQVKRVKKEARGRPKGTTNNKLDRRSRTVGNLIKRARVDLGLGLSQIAKKVGVTLQFISNIEQGRAPLPWKLVKKMAKALGVPVEDLATANLEASSTFKQYIKVAGRAA